MKLSGKQYAFLSRQLKLWQENELLSKEQTEKLEATFERKEINWKKVAQDMLGLAVFFMVIAFLHLVADEWVLKLLTDFFSMSDRFFMVFLLILMVVFAVSASYVQKLSKPFNGKVFEEALLLMSVLSGAGMFYYSSSVFEFSSGVEVLLVLIASMGTLWLGRRFSSLVIWLLGCLGVSVWFGLQTTCLSDWKPSFLGTNLPVRYLIFSVFSLLFIGFLQKRKLLRWLGDVTQQFFLLLMWFSLWLVALFGNFSSWTSWENASPFMLLPGGILMAVTAFMFWWMGRKKGNFTWVWMGSIALLGDAYTQYFLFLWNPLPAALFFFLLALSFLILGRKAEVIWGK